MRYARKLTLLAIAAVAAMAFVAAPASATNAISVVNEKTGTVCSAINPPHTTGGCAVHAVGSMELQANIFGFWVHEATCTIEFQMRIAGNGVAAIDNYNLTPGDANCTNGAGSVATECNLPWEGKGERTAAHNIQTEIGPAASYPAGSPVCITPAEHPTGGNCEGNMVFDIVENEATEVYSANFVNDRIGTSLCRINGNAAIESLSTANAAIHVN